MSMKRLLLILAVLLGFLPAGLSAVDMDNLMPSDFEGTWRWESPTYNDDIPHLDYTFEVYSAENGKYMYNLWDENGELLHKGVFTLKKGIGYYGDVYYQIILNSKGQNKPKEYGSENGKVIYDVGFYNEMEEAFFICLNNRLSNLYFPLSRIK